MAGQRKKPRKSPASKERPSGGAPIEGDDLLRKQARQLLKRATELIGVRSGWTRDHLARDRNSKPVSPSSERAVRFCVGGALFRAAHEQFDVQFRLARPGEQPDDEAELRLAPMREAFRLLGRAMEALYLGPIGLSVREEGSGDERRIFLATAEDAAISVPEIRASWPSIVYGINDSRKLKRDHLLGALALATLISYGKTEPSRETEVEGGS